MHFVSYIKTTKEILDPKTHILKTVTVLEFEVDRLNGQPVNSRYSITSEKHAADLDPDLGGDRYRGYEYIITKFGQLYQTRYSLDKIPFVSSS
mgnify:CR=1 FL=1